MVRVNMRIKGAVLYVTNTEAFGGLFGEEVDNPLSCHPKTNKK
jgi:hypothetical protein